ncbi:hypothetical protein MD484_g4618, partial [Candolleomyces efflorescens]
MSEPASLPVQPMPVETLSLEAFLQILSIAPPPSKIHPEVQGSLAIIGAAPKACVSEGQKAQELEATNIELPTEVPDLMFALSSESDGDVGFVSFTGKEIMDARSSDVNNPVTLRRGIDADDLGDSIRVSLSFTVWPRVVKADVFHHGLSSHFKIVPSKKAAVEAPKSERARTVGDLQSFFRLFSLLGVELKANLTATIILMASKLDAELLDSTENSNILDRVIASQIAESQGPSEDTILTTALKELASTASTPPLEPSSPFVLCRVGKAFIMVWHRTQQLEHLNQGIDNLQKGLAALSGEPRTWMLALLSSALGLRYRRFENRDDLFAAISVLQKQLKIKDMVPEAAKSLCHLFQHLFYVTTEPFWLVEAYKTAELALNSVSTHPHAHFDALEGLSSTISQLSPFVDTDKSKLRQQAIALQSRAIGMLQPSDARLVNSYFNLGKIYEAQFQESNQLQDIKEAIISFRKALELCAPDRLVYPTLFATIGQAHRLQWTVTREESDLEEAILYGEKALQLATNEDNRAQYTSALGKVYAVLCLSSSTSRDSHLNRAISLFSSASLTTAQPPIFRLRDAAMWAKLELHRYRPTATTDSLLEAFATVVNLITVVAGIDYTVKRRYDFLSKRSPLILTAATVAILLGRCDKALEWLEQGRGLVWSQLHGLRTPLEALRSYNPQLAEAYEGVSRRLESAGLKGMISSTERLNMSLDERRFLNEQTADHVKAAREHEDLLKTIRTTVPGFDNFLLSRPCAAWFEHLPDSGPVVVINVHKDQCNALALMAGADAPLHIPLPDCSRDQIETLCGLMKASLDSWGLRMRGDDDGFDTESPDNRVIQPATRKRKGRPGIASPIEKALRQLWLNIVKPILVELGISKSEEGSERPRIWWCSTGPLSFLPLHAAGIYRGPEAENLSDYAVSSYIPTVAVLAERLRNPNTIPADKSGLMMVCVPGTGLSRIPGTLKEVTYIDELLKDSDIRVSRVQEKEATAKAVLEGTERYSCVHFACHGIQNAEDPLRSAFVLDDGKLELSTIIKSNLRSADLAFLSACQTSTGDPKLSEEAVHLAGAMLAAGYRGVVATMWSIQDRYAPEFAEDFYKNLLLSSVEGDGRKTIDGARAAYALDYAVKKLRDKIGVSEADLLAWIPYVHFGL